MNGTAPAQHRRPLYWAAFWTGVLVPVGYFVFLLALSALRGAAFTVAGVSQFLMLLFMIGFPASMGASMVLGLPLTLGMRRARLLRAPWVCVAAVLVGLATASVMFNPFGHGRVNWDALMTGATLGAFGGVLFCLLAGIGTGRRARKVLISNTSGPGE